MSGNRRIDDDHDRWGNENAQRSSSRDHPRGEAHVVARVKHGPHGDDAHENHHGTDQPTCNAPEGTDNQGCYSKRGGKAPEGQLNAVKHLVHEGAAFHDVAHEHKERNGQERVVGHSPVGSLHHQGEDAVVSPRLTRVIKGCEAKHHAQPHEGEGSREAEHDHNNDQGQHDETKDRISHGAFS